MSNSKSITSNDDTEKKHSSEERYNVHEEVDYDSHKDLRNHNKSIRQEVNKLRKENEELHERIREVGLETEFMESIEEEVHKKEHDLSYEDLREENQRLKDKLDKIKEINAKLYRKMREHGDKIGYP